jgi:hypothetical protein
MKPSKNITAKASEVFAHVDQSNTNLQICMRLQLPHAHSSPAAAV